QARCLQNNPPPENRNPHGRTRYFHNPVPYHSQKPPRSWGVGMSSPLLVVEQIHKSYGRLEALKGVSFSVAEGELFGLLGPNGAGKTTLVSILACLLAPSAGNASLAGTPLRMSDAAIRRQIGIVPQDLAVYGELTARENLMFFGKLYGLRGAELRRRVGAILDAVALADRAGERVAGYSGGMKRRLTPGVALLHRPPLALLDDP